MVVGGTVSAGVGSEVGEFVGAGIRWFVGELIEAGVKLVGRKQQREHGGSEKSCTCH